MGFSFKNSRKKFHEFLDTHKKERIIFEYVVSFFATVISAILTAFAFKTFMSPNIEGATTIISGGAGGIARTISLIAEMITGDKDKLYVVYSIAYAILNVPCIFIAFKFIGVRFGIFTTINVALVSLITNFVNLDFIDQFAKHIACVVYVDGKVAYQAGLLTRAILAALFSGLGSSIAYAAGTSAGGSDTIGYFLALRKSASIGPYLFIINAIVVVTYSILSFFAGGINQTSLADACLVLTFAIIYQLVLSLVIDFINRRNKKEQLQIITKKENMSSYLLANIPHGATVLRAKGAFTGEERLVIYTIVSFHETKGVIDLVRQFDPDCFINITSVKQVYGRFFIKPTN